MHFFSVASAEQLRCKSSPVTGFRSVYVANTLKPGLEFRVSGRDNDKVHFDNLKVWELESLEKE